MSFQVPSMKDLRDEVKKAVDLETKYLKRELENLRKKCLILEQKLKSR